MVTLTMVTKITNYGIVSDKFNFASNTLQITGKDNIIPLQMVQSFNYNSIPANFGKTK